MESSSPRAVVLKMAAGDNIVVALRELRAGEQLTLDGTAFIVERNTAIGHKIAVCAIAAGEQVFKYQCPIGRATRDIAAGDCVHTHNLASDYLPSTTLPA
jgi:altronate dehydratase small subunit